MDRQKSAKTQHEALREHFEHVYELYSSDIFRFCALKISDRERALDVTQDVFTRYWQTVRIGTKIKNERAFLYTLARNLIIDWYRRKKEQSLDVMNEAGFEFQSSDDVDIVTNAEAKEVLRRIAELDEDSREVLLLRFVDGFSPKEIASVRGESANAVSVRINRAVKKVRELMDRSSIQQNSMNHE